MCSKYIDPEKAHALAIFFLKIHFLNKIYRPQNFKNLNTTFCNIKIKNPIGLAAGFDKNAEVIKGLFKLGVGLIEIGAVTPKPQYGNRKPRVFRLQKDLAIINKLGFNNFGMEKINENLKKNNSNGILGINVGANKNSQDKALDFIKVISYFSNDIDYFTLNISSPNTYGLRDFQNKKNESLTARYDNDPELRAKLDELGISKDQFVSEYGFDASTEKGPNAIDGLFGEYTLNRKDFVKIKNGIHRSKPITNAVFPLLKGVSYGKRGAFVTVDATALMGAEFTKIRVLVDSPNDVVPATEQEYNNFIPENMKPKKKKETTKQAMDRIAERFKILDEMTQKLGIFHLLDRQIQQLSGGELQRFATAVVVVQVSTYIHVYVYI